MSLIRKVLETQKKLSKVNGDFLEFVEKNPGALKASNFKLMDLNDQLFALQPWPTFVNQVTRNEFQEAGVKLFELIKKIPQRIFDFDIKRISDYYEIPGDLAKQQLEGVTDEHLRNLVARGDFILSTSGLKCLEYNVTANLGGWYVPVWENLYLMTPIIAEFMTKYTVDIRNKNLIQQLLEHIIETTSSGMTGNDREINIVLVTNFFAQYENSMGRYLDNLYKQSLLKQNPPLKGGIFICDYHHLEKIDDYIYYRDKKIHAAIEMYNGSVSLPVREVFKAGNIKIINGPVTDLLSSKLNLALLSTYGTANNNIFNDEEKRIIEKYVPWSRKIINGSTNYGTETVKLENFILTNKDKLVLKPSSGYGGSGVYIGQRIPETQWEELIKTAFHQKNWLIQEFVDSSPGLYQAGENGCDLHDMVWGFFVLGSQYAGAWVRVLPQKANKGVINCHQGATVSIIFEVPG